MELQPEHVMHELRAGSGAPVILIAPTLGDSRAYATLASALTWPGPVMGVDSLGLDGAEVPALSIREMATALHGTLAARAAGPPWRVAGWGTGGVIAAELAARAAADREEVAFVGIFDARAPIPEMKSRPSDDATLSRMFVMAMAWAVGSTADPPASSSPASVLASLRAAGLVSGEWTERDVARRFGVFARNVRALFQHEPTKIAATVTLFESDAEVPQHPRPATLGWEPHAAKLRRISTPGTHFSLCVGANAIALAARMDRALASAGT